MCTAYRVNQELETCDKYLQFREQPLLTDANKSLHWRDTSQSAISELKK